MGQFNSAVANQQSLVEAFIEDTAPLGVVNAGDKFVLAELVLGASPLTQRTLSQRTLTAATLASNYGIAAVRSRAGTSDFLVTAENDGQVFAWLPATPGAALQRKTLSSEHVGKAWHSLERVPIAGGADALIGLRVTPGSPQTADVVFWSPYDLGFSAPPIIQQSLPFARIAASPNAGGANAVVGVKLWDSEGNPATVELQFQSPLPTGPWADAALITIDGHPAANHPPLEATPVGTAHTLVWNAAQDMGSSFSGGVLLRARAKDASGTGAWSEPAFFVVEANPDADGDGMPDDWESTHGVSDPDEDRDHDGQSNLKEYQAGTTPTDGASVFEITGGERAEGGFTVTWSAVPGKTYQVRYTGTLTGPWLEDLPNSLPTAQPGQTALSYTDTTAGSAPRRFYQIRLVQP